MKVKEESEKAGLKLNIRKTQIMVYVYMYMYSWFTLPYSRNKHNFLKQL